MKKKYKALIYTGSIVTGAAIANYAIFKANKEKPFSRFNESIYKFRFGDINYTVHGEGEPLLLIHGIYVGASYHEWEKNIMSLSKHYKVYAIDLLGFGASTKPAITYSPYLYVTLINSFIKYVIKDSPYIIASSTSCPLSTVATLFNTATFKKLMLVSPSINSNSKPKKYSKFVSNLIESPIIGTSIYNIICSKIQLKRYLEKNIYYNPLKVTDTMIEEYSRLSHFRGIKVKYPIAAFLGGCFEMDILYYLDKVSIPLHIVWGEEVEETLGYSLEKIKSINPNIDISIIKESKMLPHNENPKDFYKVVRQFFN